ncbi:hypothetical protein RMCBS344292_12582 [Rhizopus microsporus]|nr:hypothetical protein RMCBS344292_12582 [Rhizopus microsporus]
MVEIIENQKERLGKSRHFLINGRKIEQEKYKVIENMEKVNEMDNQIIQSHQIISDELAHFQAIHSKEMIKNIKGVVKNTLEIERYNLAILIQSLNKFSHLKYYLCLASYLFKLYFLLKSLPCFFLVMSPP